MRPSVIHRPGPAKGRLAPYRWWSEFGCRYTLDVPGTPRHDVPVRHPGHWTLFVRRHLPGLYAGRPCWLTPDYGRDDRRPPGVGPRDVYLLGDART